MANLMLMRVKKELQMLNDDPPHGISAWPKDERLDSLEATIQGPSGTPYENGTFKLEVSLGDRYPMEPPKVRFVTQIYHPNIDNGGRICLDLLVMPPKGAWKPSLNIPTILTSIQSLISEPNPDDGLMSDITDEYKHNRTKFNETAKSYTRQYATAAALASSSNKRKSEANSSSDDESKEVASEKNSKKAKV
eukprot:TRINITY_DN8847_c0_g1_i1.p1 TRINITY_DN8847_c0_g1~~TRINITY_DN8847_c0_g1_i1.p1  ORF type:complete len:219 (-),score=36.05 TRINITY_DN8847_c0_g1_i1:235-810(-)